MDMTDTELKLLAGLPIEIEDAGLLYIPTLKEIISIGHSVYMQYVGAILFDKSNIEGADVAGYGNFEVLLAISVHNEDFRNTILESLSLFFKREAQLDADESGAFFCLGDSGYRVNEKNFETIQEIVKKSNHIKIEKKPEYNPGNEKAKKMIEDILAAKKNRPKPKETMNLQSIISGLSWRENGINMLNIFDLTIYQVYIGFFATSNIDKHYFTLSGIYSGTVDSKNIDMSDISWAKILNND